MPPVGVSLFTTIIVVSNSSLSAGLTSTPRAGANSTCF